MQIKPVSATYWCYFWLLKYKSLTRIHSTKFPRTKSQIAVDQDIQRTRYADKLLNFDQLKSQRKYQIQNNITNIICKII